MMRPIIKTFIFGFAVLFACSQTYAVESGLFVSVEGRVDILKMGKDEAAPARIGDIVSSGDVIRTKSLSKAEIKFKDDSVLKLAENTRLEIEEYTLDGFGLRNNAVINLQRGEVRAAVIKTVGPTNFFLNTPNASASVKDSDIFAFYQKSATGVLVNEGSLSITNSSFPEEVVDVWKGYMSVVPPDQPPQQPRPYLDIEKRHHEILTAALPRPVEKDPSEIKAVVVKVNGEVKFRRAGTTEWRDVVLNEILGSGDQIATKESGMAELRLDNDNIITVKPNSTVILRKLRWDLGTGDYENLIEVNLGKIRAKIQRFEGNSKFEVKTPTAVASVRGTILFLAVLPGLAMVYFEDGEGIIRSLISQVSKAVQDGQTSSADDQGNVSDPVDATDEEKSDWSSGWDPGQSQGYSPPGNESEIGTAGYTGADDQETTGISDTPVTGGESYVDVPPELETAQTPASSQLPQTNLIASIDGGFGFDVSEGTSLKATLMSTTSSTPWSGDSPDGSSPATLQGTYENPNDDDLWFAELSGNGSDGGAFVGVMGGSWHSWEGSMAGIYVDPSGTTGTMFGYLDGTNNAIDDTLTGSGNLYIIPIATTDILPAQLIDADSNLLSTDDVYGYMKASFDSNPEPGYFDAEFYKNFISLEDESWGIWFGAYRGEYDRPADFTALTEYNWSGRGGGIYTKNPTGYLISRVEGIDDLDSSLRMDIMATYLDTSYQGAFYGTVLGVYQEADSYDFDGIGVGGYAEEPLTFSGVWGRGDDSHSDDLYFFSEIGSLYYNDYGYIERAGEESGLIGSTTPEWGLKESFPVTAIGIYREYGEIGRYIWNTPIFSYNLLDESFSITNGAFLGVTAGIWNAGEMDGSAAALYAYPAGEDIYDVGFLTGDIAGEYYPAISMWMANGILSPTVVETGIELDGESIEERPYAEEIDNARFFGDFDGEGGIEGWLTQGYTISPYEDADWGIFDLKFGDGNAYYNPDPRAFTNWSGAMGGVDDEYEDTSYWLAELSGSWENDEIRAEVNGALISDATLGTIKGKFYGVNSAIVDTWVGTSIGIWQEQALGFGGRAEGGFAYFDAEESELMLDDEDEGISFLFGGTESLWEDSVPVTAIGEFENLDEYSLWVSDFEGNIYGDSGAHWLGTVGGVNVENVLQAGFLALYVRPDGLAGYRTGYIMSSDEEGNFSTLIGDFYPGIEMFEATGNLTAYLDVPTSIPPGGLDDNSDYFDHTYFEGLIAGDLSGTLYGESLNLDDHFIEQNWGIWRAACGGSGSPNSRWQSAFSGIVKNESEEKESYLLGTIRDTDRNSEGILDGEFNGFWFNPAGESDNVKVGKVEGGFIGNYIDVPDGTDTWQALGVGEWVEVTDLLTEGEGHLGFDMQQLEDFVSVPITEVYTNILTGSNDFITQATMDISLYQSELAHLWTALIYGNYASEPVNPSSWNLNLNSGSDDVALQGRQWEENKWLATVSGEVNGSDIEGEAAGTYDNGEFLGAGAGTVETAQEELNE